MSEVDCGLSMIMRELSSLTVPTWPQINATGDGVTGTPSHDIVDVTNLLVTVTPPLTSASKMGFAAVQPASSEMVMIEREERMIRDAWE
jgi:hypothetical protein